MQVGGTGNVGLSFGAGTTNAALSKTTQQLQKILQQLASGLQITQASDNAAGLSISEQMNAQIGGMQMASQNVTEAQAALNITDSAFSNTSGLLQQQRTLAIQASNSTLTDQQRTALDTQYQQISQEIDRAANTAQFNTQPVANGTGLGSGNAQIQEGANAGRSTTLPQISLSTARLGTNGTSIATQTGATAAITALNKGVTNLNNQWTQVGAMVNSLGSAFNNLSVAQVNMQAARSVITDLDTAQGIASLTQTRLLQEGATKALSMFEQMNKSSVLGLLQ